MMQARMHRRIETRGLLYIPETGVETGAKAPLVCFLHGAGESAEGAGHSYERLQRLLRHGSPAALAEEGSPLVAGCLVLCPQLPERRRWSAADAEWVDLLVSDAVRDHGGDPGRLLLTGFSLGGEGVFRLASASAHRWSALWAVDPALQPGTPPPPPGARVLVHHGTEQPGAEHRPAFSQVIARAGGSQVALDADHTQTCRQAYSDAAAYARLLGA
jgi:poly(3-hydroxybutyrate) depolymerase